jgi:hypothetical protein
MHYQLKRQQVIYRCSQAKSFHYNQLFSCHFSVKATSIILICLLFLSEEDTNGPYGQKKWLSAFAHFNSHSMTWPDHPASRFVFAKWSNDHASV